ncbi:hypothetical protein [Nocardia sp. NBC_01329]|uniref:hypothetical protein n=1 Tax=Nocardia sp. NBC_01329 TaxID=2903594 RepID=UPI002E14B553|nr:hypothetical protein OG405_20065 [Nocardia sp. NBC_01329]
MTSIAILTEYLPVIAAKLGVEESALSAVIGASKTASVPTPAASDDVSCKLAASFCAYEPRFYTPTATAVGYWLQGAEVLVPVSTDYDATDGHGGAEVGGHLPGLAAI